MNMCEGSGIKKISHGDDESVLPEVEGRDPVEEKRSLRPPWYSSIPDIMRNGFQDSAAFPLPPPHFHLSHSLSLFPPKKTVPLSHLTGQHEVMTRPRNCGKCLAGPGADGPASLLHSTGMVTDSVDKHTGNLQAM